MRRFWRLSIGMGAGLVYAGLSVTILEAVHNSLMTHITSILGGRLIAGDWRTGVAVPIGFFLPAFIVAFGVYELLNWKYAEHPRPRETLCRKCGYILRGISEPRCPECGERI